VDVKKKGKKYSKSECVCLYFFYGCFFDKTAKIKAAAEDVILVYSCAIIFFAVIVISFS